MNDPGKHDPQQATMTEKEKSIERELLCAGVFSLDGLDGMDWERAEKVAEYSVPLAERHFKAALKAGII